MRKSATAYISFSILLGFGLFICLCINDSNLAIDSKFSNTEVYVGVIILSILGAIAESLSMAVDENKAISISFAIDISALLLFGLAPAAIVAFCTVFFSISDFGRGHKEHVLNTPIYITLFNASNYILSILALGFVYKFIGSKMINPPDFLINFGLKADFAKVVNNWLVQSLIPILVGLFVYVIVNNLMFMFYFITVSGPRPNMLQEWFKIFQWSAISMFFIGLLGVFLTIIYWGFNPYIVLLFFFPFLMFRYAYAGMTSIQKGYIDTIQAFSAALEVKDHYTIGHARRVEKYCEIIAMEMGLSLGRTKVLKYASLLHDIGKIGISEAILNKSDRLTIDEYEEIKKHPVIGAQMLENIQFLKKEVRIIRAHHVHYDGKGYPADAADDAKMLEAQILCAADSFDAMTSDRAYRPAMSMEEAIDEMIRYSGSQFAPEVVTNFIRGLNKRKSKDELNEIMK